MSPKTSAAFCARSDSSFVSFPKAVAAGASKLSKATAATAFFLSIDLPENGRTFQFLQKPCINPPIVWISLSQAR
jgi:hypothetical protein